MRRRAQHVVRPHPRGEQRLVGVAQRRVRDRERLRARRSRANSRGPSSWRRCREPGGGSPCARGGQLRRRVGRRRRLAVRVVDRDLGHPAQQPAGAVAAGRRARELRALVDERRPHPAGPELGVVEQRAEEALVGPHAAHPHLLDGAPRPCDRGLEVRPAGGDLEQQRIEVRRDLGADVGRALVQAHAGAARRAVGGDRPVSGRNSAPGSSVVIRHCSATPRWRSVSWRSPRSSRRRAARDEQLRAHEVDVRRLLGHGVLDLDARVHLDEHVPAVSPSTRNSTVPAFT